MMTDHTTINGARADLSPLRLPPQAAPIDRTVSGAALADGSGIEALTLWDPFTY